MRMLSFQDALTVLRHYGIDPAAAPAIDVGGTREVTLKTAAGTTVAVNPLLAANPTITFLDHGFNAEFIGAHTDLKLDFLDPRALAPLAERFDLVFSFDTIEHISNPFLFCRNLETITKPGGAVYVATVFQYVYHPSPEDYYRFSPAGLRQCFTDPANPARDRLAVAWCDWESDGDGVALLAVKGPAPERTPLVLPRAARPEPSLGAQARALARSAARRLRGK